VIRSRIAALVLCAGIGLGLEACSSSPGSNAGTISTTTTVSGSTIPSTASPGGTSTSSSTVTTQPFDAAAFSATAAQINAALARLQALLGETNSDFNQASQDS
jgi:hypothetical protein